MLREKILICLIWLFSITFAEKVLILNDAAFDFVMKETWLVEFYAPWSLAYYSLNSDQISKNSSFLFH
jgi:hypothetical protein